ncbi:hypothetical protein [Brumimicrobium oceani]|uniref:Lipoprotein n=1 Tax=Brumimicrobium oceani TaxID=2100725 RepID=A0A2U2XAD0_9FLAO|nr:hypothetical protein [Brumimicrobium oceani]PWH84759.1 hypothetical protein DIT68_12575 [Brumimicrobium oceani]
MKHLLYIVLILFFATSCKKKTAVVIQAQDITSDGAAYAGQEYAVAESWTPFQETKSKIVATGFLDANGKASFNLKMKNNRKYVLGVSQPDNICDGGLIQHYLDHDKNNTVIFKYAQCSYLKFNVHNINCNGPNDEVKYKRIWLTGNNEGTQIVKLGCFNFEGNYFELPAGNYRYDWEVTKNATTTYHSENFTLVAGDSSVFQIDY